jgi:hypothetical protein
MADDLETLAIASPARKAEREAAESEGGMSEIAPIIFLYTAAAGISKADAERLAAVGIVPVKVKELSGIQILACPAPLPVGPNAMLWAAMSAIKSTGYGKHVFFDEMHAALDAVRPRVTTPETGADKA